MPDTEGVKSRIRETLVLLGIIFLVGLGLRVAHVECSLVVDPFRADAGEYMAGAKNLLEYGIYSSDVGHVPPIPDSFRSPGYSLYLAAVHAVVGADDFYDIARLLQAVLGALMVPLVFVLARRFLNVTFAMIAAALTATNPHLITATGYILTETLFSFLLLAALTLWYSGLSGGGRVKLIASGVLFGLAVLTNETALIIPPVLAGAWLIWGRAESRLRPAVLLLVVFFLFPVGWRIRNAVSVPPEGRTGGDRALATLVHGTYPGFIHEDPECKYFPYQDDPQYAEFASSRANFIRIFKERFSEKPWRYLKWYLLEKPYYLYGFGYLQGNGDIYIYPTLDSVFDQVPASKLFYWLHRILHPVVSLLLLAAYMLWTLERKKGDFLKGPGPLLLVFLLYTLIGTVFAPWPRYLVPLKPLLFAASLWPIQLAIIAWRRKRSPSTH